MKSNLMADERTTSLLDRWAYWQYAELYAELFKQYDIELEMRKTGGSLPPG